MKRQKSIRQTKYTKLLPKTYLCTHSTYLRTLCNSQEANAKILGLTISYPTTTSSLKCIKYSDTKTLHEGTLLCHNAAEQFTKSPGKQQ